MTVKNFLLLTAIVEGITGLVLLVTPQFIVPLLLSTPLEETGGIISARIAGIAIISLVINCWYSKTGKCTNAVLYSLLFYNLAVTTIFLFAKIEYNLNTALLWIVASAHVVLAIWGLRLLKMKSED
jgi:hypothetical protein